MGTFYSERQSQANLLKPTFNGHEPKHTTGLIFTNVFMEMK